MVGGAGITTSASGNAVTFNSVWDRDDSYSYLHPATATDDVIVGHDPGRAGLDSLEVLGNVRAIHNGGGPGMAVGFDGSNIAMVWNYENSSMRFGVNNTEYLHLSSDGRLRGYSNGGNAFGFVLYSDGGELPQLLLEGANGSVDIIGNGSLLMGGV